MAVNLPPLGQLLPVPGVRMAVAAAGIKAATAGATDPAAHAKADMALLVFAAGSQVAGVFTDNQFAAAPVEICRSVLGQDVAGFLINSGNANAATGVQGVEDANEILATCKESLGCSAELMPFSTGVIGERLPVAAMQHAIPGCVQALSADAWLDAATAIMTTDTQPKVVSRTQAIGEGMVTITGMAKGSGMIQPNMATMLSYVFCDAQVPFGVLQRLCKEVADASFNRVTVDGDTSTNDCFMLVATGANNQVSIDSEHAAGYAELRAALSDVAIDLAQRIVRDAEGASKFVTVEVAGAESAAQCLQIAYTVANSPLVKTALFASDPNWGRICMAMGRAGVAFEQSQVNIFIGDVCVMRSGMVAPGYTEAEGARVMQQDEIVLRLEVGSGAANERVWTSDLSHDYVTINSEYRT